MTAKVDVKIIVNHILDRMNEDPLVDAAMVKVDVTPRGTVTLRGSVPTYRARRAAEEDSWAVEGVKRVHDFLVVPMPDPAAFMDARFPGDEGLLATVNQYLRGQDILNPLTIDVAVEDGVVTLRGSVNAFWKRRRAEEVVLGVDGVEILNTYLTVVPTVDLGDEVIAERIIDGMQENSLIEAQAVDVKVNRGLVTLQGTVSGHLAKREAFEIALYTEGVIDVRDELIIQRA
ncbi:MAG: hypothetical protein JWO30_3302 [Fibrobacteres bacterium]|nr:hypothetical protein [Fibrobacterota bacterium]